MPEELSGFTEGGTTAHQEPGSPLAATVFGPEGARVATAYVRLLASAGVERGLIGPREIDRLWDRHLFNSVAVRDLVPQGSSVADVGSGAGLPGLPLAIARPDLQVTLIEPLLRRSIFLIEAVDDLGLSDRVRVVRARAEDVREQFDVVTARAVAPLERLVGWCRQLRNPRGQILALKGRSAADEMRSAGPVLAAAGLTAELLSVRAASQTEATTVVRLSASR